MRRVAIIIGAVWLVLLGPGMVAGALWSGQIPLWPPVVSVQMHDRMIWAVLFGLSYGLPIVAAVLFYFSRRTGRPLP
jgi:hypothetical protein